jgi:hypothetical protein
MALLADYLPPAIDDRRRVGLVAAQHELERLAYRGHVRVVERPLAVERRVPARRRQSRSRGPTPARTVTLVIVATIAPPPGPGTYPAGNRPHDPCPSPWRPSTDPEEHQMPEVTTVVDSYIAMWNETDRERRRFIIEQTWSEDGSYVDPHAAVAGVDGLDALVAAVQEQFPGHRFVLASGPDTHHDRMRFTWQLVGESGDAIATGTDVAVVADDGRLRDVTGFLEAA